MTFARDAKKNVLNVEKDTAEVRDLYPSSLELFFKDHPLLSAYLCIPTQLQVQTLLPGNAKLRMSWCHVMLVGAGIRISCAEYEGSALKTGKTLPRIPPKVIGMAGDERRHSLSEYTTTAWMHPYSAEYSQSIRLVAIKAWAGSLHLFPRQAEHLARWLILVTRHQLINNKTCIGNFEFSDSLCQP
jgi:hypothetical protein